MADEKAMSLLNSDLTDENESSSLDYIPVYKYYKFSFQLMMICID
jgi:hypothetical protein